MDWVLIVILLVNDKPQEVMLQPFSDWGCELAADKIETKTITINGDKASVLSTECKQIKR